MKYITYEVENLFYLFIVLFNIYSQTALKTFKSQYLFRRKLKQIWFIQASTFKKVLNAECLLMIVQQIEADQHVDKQT